LIRVMLCRLNAGICFAYERALYNNYEHSGS
jgi:hypothetical protein